MKNITLLDALIVTLGSCTLSLFVLWAAGHFAGIVLFTDPPEYLKAVAENLFTVATSGVIGSTLLFLLRKQISQDNAPHYLLLIPAGTAILIGSIIFISKLIPPVRDPDHRTSVSIAELYAKNEEGSETNYGSNYIIKSNFYNPKSLTEVYIRYVWNTPEEEISKCEKVYSDNKNANDQDYEDLDQCDQSSLDIIENGSLKFRTTAFRVNFYGACRSTDGLTTLLLGKWNGSATTSGPIVSVKYDRNTNRFKESVVFSQGDISGDDDQLKNEFVNCKAGQKSFDLAGGAFPLCDCAFEQAAPIRQMANELFTEKIFSKSNGMDVVKAEPFLDIAYEELPTKKFCSGQSVKLSEIENFNPKLHIYEKDLKTFVSSIDSLGPQTASDYDAIYLKPAANPYFLRRIEGEKYAMQSIIYSEGIGSWSATLIKAYDSGTWSIVHAARLGYKILQPLEIKEHLGDDRFLVNICIHSCNDHWGVRKDAVFDLKKRTLQWRRHDQKEECL